MRYFIPDQARLAKDNVTLGGLIGKFQIWQISLLDALAVFVYFRGEEKKFGHAVYYMIPTVTKVKVPAMVTGTFTLFV